MKLDFSHACVEDDEMIAMVDWYSSSLRELVLLAHAKNVVDDSQVHLAGTLISFRGPRYERSPLKGNRLPWHQFGEINEWRTYPYT